MTDRVCVRELDGESKELSSRTIDPSRCPSYIFIPDHYRADGSCKCDDPNEKIMRSWGYRWSKKLNRWKA